MSVSLEFATANDEVDTVFCAERSKLAQKGELTPTHSFWGTRTAIIRDPFGHRWIMNGPLSQN